MASYGGGYGQQQQHGTDAYGNPVRQTDEYGNPIQHPSGGTMGEYGTAGATATGTHGMHGTGATGTHGVGLSTGTHGQSQLHRSGSSSSSSVSTYIYIFHYLYNINFILNIIYDLIIS